MYRSWVALVVSGLLAGTAAVALFAGFATPWLLAVAVLSGVGSYLAYSYAATRMVRSVYAGVGDPGVTDGGQATAEPGVGTAEGVDSVTAASEAAEDGEDGGEYDEWTWADVDADDPFWSDDEADWEDPWETETTAPNEASAGKGDWRERRGTGSEDDERGRWWEGMGGGADGDASSRDGTDASHADRTAEAYEVLGLEPGAGPEAVREAYRERAKETHPDTDGGSAEEFIRVREAYEYLRARLSGTDGAEA